MKEVNELVKLERLFNIGKLSHAYLIETNDVDKCNNDLIELIKIINCPQQFKNGCNQCNICNLINQKLLPSLIVVEPDGINIKKEQILDLKKRFSTKPIFTENNIYIIKNAEKLNGASANTMLKFLEEPTENILGFFITSNINNVFSTIRSRCEVLSIMYDEDSEINNSKYFDIIKEYLYKIEVEKKDKIMYNRSVILNKFSEKKDIENIFKIILEIYQKSFYNIYFPGNENFLFLKKIDPDQMLKRIDLIINLLANITYNVNIELLLDKFVIELSDNSENLCGLF